MNLTPETLDAVATGRGVVLVDIWAPWCAPCKVQSPIIFEVESHYGRREDLTIAKYDCDQNMDVLGNYDIMGVPALLFFKDGELKHKNTGVMTKDAIIAVIDGLLTND